MFILDIKEYLFAYFTNSKPIYFYANGNVSKGKDKRPNS